MPNLYNQASGIKGVQKHLDFDKVFDIERLSEFFYPINAVIESSIDLKIWEHQAEQDFVEEKQCKAVNSTSVPKAISCSQGVTQRRTGGSMHYALYGMGREGILDGIESLQPAPFNHRQISQIKLWFKAIHVHSFTH